MSIYIEYAFLSKSQLMQMFDFYKTKGDAACALNDWFLRMREIEGCVFIEI